MTSEDTSEGKVLSAEESEALLAEGGSGDPPAGESNQTGVRDFDLSAWEQVALDRIPALEAINDDTAEAIDEIWSSLCRKTIVTSPKGIQRRPWRDYQRELQAPVSANLIEIQPRGELGLVVVRPETAYAMVDLFFGGNGHGSRDQRLTSLTHMETRIVERFVSQLAERMQEAWNHHVAIEIAPSETHFDIDTTPIASPSDPIVIVQQGFEIRDATHTVEIVWPSRLIDVLKAERFSSAAIGKTKVNWSENMTRDLQAARIDLRAILGEIPIRLSDIANARPGDIFTGESLTEVKVYAGDRPILEGTLGAHRGRHAVKVKSPVPQKYLGELNG